MNIITVIPLTRAKVGETLSYFTAAEVSIGSIVSVPLRSKSIHAIVCDIKPAENLKIDIKRAGFEIRKLNKIRATNFFPTQFMAAAAAIAEYYATTVGAVIDSLVSDSILENVNKIVPPLPAQNSFMNVTMSKDQTFAVQGDDSDRMSSWRSLIRQEFARKKSIAIYTPTIEDARNIFNSLEKGIEGYIFLLHSSLTKKKIEQSWNEIAEITHPIVIISTGSFSVLPRGDIETVIIERENSRGWISQKTPYIDIRFALETIARKRRQTIFLADTLLRTETLDRLDKHDIDQGSPFKWRSISNAKDYIVDMRGNKSRQAEDSSRNPAEHPFRVISPELEDLIRRNREESTHLFILTVRRGSAPMTVCSDCETIVSCKNCSAPVVLHTSVESGRNYFMCHNCGERRSADETCANCGGWRLTPLGIGIDRVAEDIISKFPDIDMFKIDSDSTKSDKQIEEVIEKFRARPGSILLGTEMALTHISEKLDHVAIASLDSLFALPDFRIQEKIMHMLIRLRTQAERSIVVQTRKPEEKVFEYGLKGNLSDFYRTTLQDRKQFNYPPFSLLIKITLEGKKEKISKEMAEIQIMITPYEIDIFPAFTATSKGNSQIHGLIKVETIRWPDLDLISKLRTLGPHVSVKINPETLL